MNAAIVPLDEHRARQLTDRIRQAADDLWALLLEAHEGRAWSALGYATWGAYVRTEFAMSRSRAYQLLDQATVVRDLTSVAGASTSVDITEAAARDLKPHLQVVKEAIRQAVENVPEERVAEIVAEVVEEERAKITRRRRDREERAALAAEHDPGPDFDWARDQELLREGGAIARVIGELAGFRPATVVLTEHPPGDFDTTLIVSARNAYDWLAVFIDAWEGR